MLQPGDPQWDTQLDPFHEWGMWFALGRSSRMRRAFQVAPRPADAGAGARDHHHHHHHHVELGFAHTRVAEDLRWMGLTTGVVLATLCMSSALGRVLHLRSPLLSFWVTVWFVGLSLFLFRAVMILRNRRIRDQGLPVPSGCWPFEQNLFLPAAAGGDNRGTAAFELVSTHEGDDAPPDEAV